MAERKTWGFDAKDGTHYDVDADTEEEAWQKLDTYLTEETRTRVQGEYANLPLGSKVWQGFSDAARNTVDYASLGGADYLYGAFPGTSVARERQKTEESKMRAGPAADTAAMLTGYGALGYALPSVVRPIVDAFGGPAPVRALTSGIVAGGENAALGATESFIRDQDPREGALQGAIGGVLGNTAAGLIKQGVRGYKAGRNFLREKGFISGVAESPESQIRTTKPKPLTPPPSAEVIRMPRAEPLAPAPVSHEAEMAKWAAKSARLRAEELRIHAEQAASSNADPLMKERASNAYKFANNRAKSLEMKLAKLDPSSLDAQAAAEGIPSVPDEVAEPKEATQYILPRKAVNPREAAMTALNNAIRDAKLHSRGPVGKYDENMSHAMEEVLKRHRAQFSPEEIAAIEHVITGDPATYLARGLGKIDNPLTRATGAGSIGAGFAGLLDPITTAVMIGIPSMGMVGRMTANAGTKRQVGEMMGTITGRKPPAMDPKTQENIYRVLRSLGLGGG